MDSASDHASASVVLGVPPTVRLTAGGDSGTEERRATRETRRGIEQINLNFSDVAHALRDLANGLATKRVWIVLDEWSSVPQTLSLTSRSSSCDACSHFRCSPSRSPPLSSRVVSGWSEMMELPHGIGLGADVAANLDLDQFMVFEQE